jgi:hypothetical protein
MSVVMRSSGAGNRSGGKNRQRQREAGYNGDGEWAAHTDRRGLSKEQYQSIEHRRRKKVAIRVRGPSGGQLHCFGSEWFRTQQRVKSLRPQGRSVARHSPKPQRLQRGRDFHFDRARAGVQFLEIKKICDSAI